MDKVVNCNKCSKYFMYTKVDVKCPFCAAPYENRKMDDLKTSTVSDVKKDNKKTHNKGSFKMWK